MNTLDSDQDKDECDVVKHDTGSDGHLTLKVYLLVRCAQNYQLQDRIAVNSERDDGHQEWRSRLDMGLIFVSVYSHKNVKVNERNDTSNDHSQPRVKKHMNILNEILGNAVRIFGTTRVENGSVLCVVFL